MSSGFDLSSVFPSSISPSATSPIGGAGGHRAVGVMPNPIAPSVSQAPQFIPGDSGNYAQPMQPFGGGMGGGADIMPPNSFTPTSPVMGTPAHGNIFGGGADISEKAGKNIKQILDDIAGLDLPYGMGGSGGGGGGVGGGRGGGGGSGISAPNPTSPVTPGISALAPNPGFPYVLPRRKEDQYSGGL
jgi:hypothetical protein